MALVSNVDNVRPTAEVAVVVVPLSWQGHLTPLLILSRLISSRDIPVHFITSLVSTRQAKTRDQASDATAIQFHEVDIPLLENPLPDPNTTIKFPAHLVPGLVHSILNIQKPVYELVLKLSKTYTRVVVIYDSVTLYSVQGLESITNAEAYAFHCVSAQAVFGIYWEHYGKQQDLPQEIAAALELDKEGQSILDTCFSPDFKELLENSEDTLKKFNSGDIYNSSRLLESFSLDLLAERKTTGTDKIWALGPFHLHLNQTKTNSAGNKCLEWLDKQSPNSVLLVAFGTTTTFTEEEIAEIAVGLERSEQKFIWVLRDADKSDIFTGDVRRAELPEGFEERVAGRGLVIRDWAPQLAILEHPSTGGFLSHCGWSSALESMGAGVPIATWPLHSDHPMIANLVTNFLKIGVEVKDWGRWKEVVPASKVESGVRRLMDSAEGDELRKRAGELGRALKEAAKENGASRVELDKFIEHITR